MMGNMMKLCSLILVFFFFLSSINPTVSQTESNKINVTAISDLEDPMQCPVLSWNAGWIAVATNAFSTSTTCCNRRVVGWKLYDDVLHQLKGNPFAPPYCFYTKRLGSELVMKTLVATRCGLITRLRCGDSHRFFCDVSTNRCTPINNTKTTTSRPPNAVGSSFPFNLFG